MILLIVRIHCRGGADHVLNAASSASPAGPPPTVTTSKTSGVEATVDAKRLRFEGLRFKRQWAQMKRVLLIGNLDGIVEMLPSRDCVLQTKRT